MSVLPKQLEAKEFLGEGAEERAWSVHGARGAQQPGAGDFSSHLCH